MEQRPLDAFARALADAPSRRNVLRRLGSAVLAAVAASLPRRSSAQAGGTEETVELASRPRECSGDRCQLCLIGLTGGGVVSTAAGDAQLVLFASRPEVDSGDPAAGFVRWVVTGGSGSGMTLESVGPIS